MRIWPRRRLRMFQFSMRFILSLIITAAVAFAIWVYPDTQETKLGHGKLQLSQQVRDAAQGEILSGWSTLLDEYGRLLVQGRNESNQPHGWWTAYHANGNKAIEGRCRGGYKTGIWRSWYPNGQLQAEWELILTACPTQADNGTQAYVSAATGPVRVYYPDGGLRVEGQYEQNLETGLWSYYDRQVRLQARGSWRNGRKHGLWKIWDTPDGPPREIAYAHGSPVEDPDRRAASLRERLCGDDLSQRIEAARDLEAMGPFGVKALTSALSMSDWRVRVLAARSLGRLGSDASPSAPALRLLLTDGEAMVRMHAGLALMSIDRENVDEHYLAMQAALAELPQATQIRIHTRVFTQILEKRPAAYHALLRIAMSEDDAHRIAAIIALPRDGLVPLLSNSLDDSDPRIRRISAEALARLLLCCQRDGPSGLPRELIEIAGRAETHPDAEVRRTFEQARSSPWGNATNTGGPVGAPAGGQPGGFF